MKKYIIDENRIILKVKETVYCKNTLLKTAYEFIDRCYIYIDKCDDYFVLELELKKDNQNTVEDIAGMFFNELICQDMRSIVSKETKNIRELLLTRALYSSYLEIEQSGLNIIQNEYSVDNIAKDWFDNE